MKNEHLQEAHNILTHCLWPAAVAAGEVASIEAARNLIAQADADFAQAAAEIRRQALEEVAAQIHARLYDHAQDPEIEDSITAQARFLEAEAIQEMVHEMIDESALAQSDQEKSC